MANNESTLARAESERLENFKALIDRIFSQLTPDEAKVIVREIEPIEITNKKLNTMLAGEPAVSKEKHYEEVERAINEAAIESDKAVSIAVRKLEGEASFIKDEGKRKHAELEETLRSFEQTKKEVKELLSKSQIVLPDIDDDNNLDILIITEEIDNRHTRIVLKILNNLRSSLNKARRKRRLRWLWRRTLRFAHRVFFGFIVLVLAADFVFGSVADEMSRYVFLGILFIYWLIEEYIFSPPIEEWLLNKWRKDLELGIRELQWITLGGWIRVAHALPAFRRETAEDKLEE